jgi:sphinganine-1-phosphate aldolase
LQYTNGIKAISLIGKSLAAAAPVVKSVVLVCVAAHGIRIVFSQGMRGIFAAVMRSVRSLPGIDVIVRGFLSREVSQTIRQITGKNEGGSDRTHLTQPVPFPAVGIPPAQLCREIEENAAKEKLCEDGKLFALVYDGAVPQSQHVADIMQAQLGASGAGIEVDEAVKLAFRKSMHTNALNPTAFPSLLLYETEVVSMCSDLLHGDGLVAGSMTSGGTESVLMAFKVYRDLARKEKPWITEPEVVAPVTIHPAIEKAAHYFGFTIRHVPITNDFKADVAAMARAINRNTIALSASAPQYVHCIIDPIREIGELALQHNLPLHVDACFGGFMLPFTESLGHPTDAWDFRVRGVTSISADLHKYGYAPKGCSVVLYRNAYYRSFQYFAYSTWPGGLFCSPSICGTRPGPNIAAAWATLKVIGRTGYEDLTRKLMATAAEMMSGINSIEGLTVMGKPQMAAFAFTRCAPHCRELFLTAVSCACAARIPKSASFPLPT